MIKIFDELDELHENCLEAHDRAIERLKIINKLEQRIHELETNNFTLNLEIQNLAKRNSELDKIIGNFASHLDFEEKGEDDD